ncbi:MAG: hypothetical protein ABJC98_08650 [Bacteroidota bacterium]
MKIFICCITLFVAVLISETTFSQISIAVTKKGIPSLKLNGKTMKPGDVQVLVLPKGTTINFDFAGIKDDSAKFTIKGVLEDKPVRKFNLDHIFFKTATNIATDNAFNLEVPGKKINLGKAFIVIVGSTTFPGATKEYTFVPQMDGLQPHVTNAKNNTAIIAQSAIDLNGMIDNNSGAKIYTPGSAVYDALKLSNNTDLLEEELKAIIKFYFPDQTIKNSTQAVSACAANPFLKSAITAGFTADLKSNFIGTSQAGEEILSSLSLSSIGGLDVTKIADGLAKFIVKRTKQELSIAFFEKLKSALDNPDIKALFPKTSELLAAVGEEGYDYKKYLQNLREAFKTDIQKIDENLPGLIPINEAFFTEHHAIRASLQTGCYIATGLKKTVHPGDLLANYPLNYLKDENINITGALKTLQLLSESFRDTTSSNGTYWVDIKYLRQLVNDKKAFKIYLGLIYQLAKNNYDDIQFEKHSIINLLEIAAANFDTSLDYYNRYKLYILRFAEKTDALNNMIKNYSNPANDSLAIELYKKYFDATVDLFSYTIKITELPGLDKLPSTTLNFVLKQELPFYFDIAQATSDLVVDVNRRNYPSSINHVVYIYDKIEAGPAKSSAATASITIAEAKPANDSAKNAAALSLTAQAAEASSKTILNNLIRYGGFLASLATAKTSDEVENLIETFALPVGSARVKRLSISNVSINAYCGLFIGHEKITSVTDNQIFNTYGLAAPIGFSASLGTKRGWSHSAFISMIDLGAVAAFRFTDNTTAQVPNIQLKDIFSPGLFYSLGIAKTPLSVNIGAQVGPNLRKVTKDTNDYSGKTYIRYSVSVCVDLPLLNLYTRSR